MRVENSVIRNITTRSVNTKFGPRNTSSLIVDEGTFQAGFGKLPVAVGDTCSFEFTNGSYGAEIVKGSLVKAGGAAAPAPAAPAPAVKAPYVPKNSGVFPIPPLAPERSIIRQNALARATELVVETTRANYDAYKAVSFEGRKLQHDALVDEVVRLARKFEAYSAGDLDMAAAKAEVEKS